MVVLHSVDCMLKSFQHLCIIGGMYILFGGGHQILYFQSNSVLQFALLPG